jgi:CHAT domain-containing protein/Tfp pilus assembly protein PilF
VAPPPAQDKAASELSDARPLEPGKAVRGEITWGQVHKYQITLGVGQYLQLVIDGREIDLVARLFGPGNQKLNEYFSPEETDKALIVSIVAQTAGVHRLEVTPGKQESPAGTYEISIRDLRASTPQDVTRIAADDATHQADRLFAQRTADGMRRAQNLYEEALRSYSSLGDRRSEAATRHNLGLSLAGLNQRPQAIESFNKALSIWRDLGDQKGEATTLNGIGQTYDSMGERGKAVEYLTRAVEVNRAVGNRRSEASALNNLATAYNGLGERRKALESYERSLALRKAGGDRRGEAVTLNNMGLVFQALGESIKALDYFNQSLLIRRDVRDTRGEAITLNNMGMVHESLGEYQRASDRYQESLPLRRKAGDKAGECRTLGNIGQLYYSMRDFQKALEFQRQSLALARAERDSALEATALNNIGLIYAAVGEIHKSIDYYDKSLAIKRARKDRLAEISTLGNIAGQYSRLGEKERALDYYNQVLEGSKGGVSPRLEAHSLHNIGFFYSGTGDMRKAIEYYGRALPLMRSTRNVRGESIALSNLGWSHDVLGEKEKALEAYNQSLRLSRAIGDRRAEMFALFGRARVEWGRDNLTEALGDIQLAVEIAESLRSRLDMEELRSSFLGTIQHCYRLNVEILMSMHSRDPSRKYDEAAMQVSDRSRARTLLEALSKARVKLTQPAHPSLVERERRLLEEVAQQADRIAEMNARQNAGERVAAARKELEELKAEYDRVQFEIRSTLPNYAGLTRPVPLTLSEMQRQLVDGDTLLLQYSLGNPHSYLWVVSDTSLTSFELPNRIEIDKVARRVHELASKRRVGRHLVEDEAEFRRQAAKLSEMILQPAASLLGKKRLVIVPLGTLQYVPFAALPFPVAVTDASQPTVAPVRRKRHLAPQSRSLIGESEIVVLPSTSTLAAMRREIVGRGVATKTIAVLADPVFDKDDPRVAAAVAAKREPVVELRVQNVRSAESTEALPDPQISEIYSATSAFDVGSDRKTITRLPFSRREAEAILATTRPGEGLRALDFKANRTVATGPDLGQYRIIHFATHGLINAERPELTGIVLSLVDERGEPQNGFLRLDDIYNMRLSADLVVLSACQTALGKEIEGEGLIGLARGFMYAGASRIVASLWKVDDVATAELMKRFYHGMLKGRLRPAAALRAAQVSMMNTERWRSPYYWAGFTLQGEWR